MRPGIRAARASRRGLEIPDVLLERGALRLETAHALAQNLSLGFHIRRMLPEGVLLFLKITGQRATGLDNRSES